MRGGFVLAVALVAAGCVAPPDLEPVASQTPLPTSPALDTVANFTAAILEAAESGEAVMLPFTVETESPVIDILEFQGSAIGLAVNLRPSAGLAPDYWTEVDGVRVTLPPIHAFEGEAVELPGSSVRVTVASEWIRGALRWGDATFLLRMNLKGNLPYDVGDAPDAGGNSSIRIEPEGGLRMYDAEEPSETDCARLVPTDVTPVVAWDAWLAPAGSPIPTTGRYDGDPLVVKVVLDGDGAYYDRLGRNAHGILFAMLHEVDLVYAYEVGLRLETVGMHVHTDVDIVGDPGVGPAGLPDIFGDPAEPPFARTIPYWNARPDVDRDVVHIVSGKAFQYGISNCIGHIGIPEHAYTFTPLDWEAQMPLFHATALAHELGHGFSAHHHYGNHVETMPQGWWATIMSQGYTPGTSMQFSTLSKSVIRGWAEAHVD